MKTIFSKEYILSNRGCYNEIQVYNLPFDEKESITLLNLLEVLPLKDFGWWLRKCDMTKEQFVNIALIYAESVLHIYEQKYPNDLRVRNCIKVTRKYLNGECSLIELKDSYSAAYDASDAHSDAHSAYCAAASASHAAGAAYCAAASESHTASVSAAAHSACAAHSAYAAAYIAYDYKGITQTKEKIKNYINSQQ